MNRQATIVMTALAPMIWGSTYLVTTKLLPAHHALTAAAIRATVAGLVLLAITRQLPQLRWVPKLLILGALNFSIFWWLLFVSAYRLPGGVAATVGAIQPFIVFALSALLLHQRLRWPVYGAAALGLVGVALITQAAGTSLDGIGIVAALGGASSMALGTVLSKLWKFPVSALNSAAWQLLAGGLLLLPFVFLFEGPLPPVTLGHLTGYFYLAVIGAAFTYVFWFRGIAVLGPAMVAAFGFLSPLTAVILGWAVLGQALSGGQLLGVFLIIASVALMLWFQNKRPVLKVKA